MYLSMKWHDFYNFWCKLNTRRIVKTCPLRFLRDYYGGSLDVMFSSFLTISQQFRWCFCIFALVPLRFLRVFLLFPLSAFLVSYSRFCALSTRSIISLHSTKLIYFIKQKGILGIGVQSNACFREITSYIFFFRPQGFVKSDQY